MSYVLSDGNGCWMDREKREREVCESVCVHVRVCVRVKCERERVVDMRL